jgi:hypothetical protein
MLLALPVDRKDIEITKEVPSLLQKFQRDKFYTAEELFFLEYGVEFDEMAPDTEAVMWGWWWGLNNLLGSLVVQGKIVTGIKVGNTGKTIGTAKKKVTLPPKLYYGLPR